MRPRDTQYRLCTTPLDYREAHAWLRTQGADELLSFPTVVARRHGAIVGLLSTHGQGAVIAGPLVVTTARPLIVAIRLVEAYERVLWAAGVRSYQFGVDLATGKAWLEMVQRYGLIPYRQDAQAAWFRRRLERRA